MSKKIAITLLTLMLIIGLTTACSNDDKKDSESSKKSDSVSTTDFEKEYNKACDKIDADVIKDIQDIDFTNVTPDEFEDAYQAAIDEYKDFHDEIDEIDVPSKYEDDWNDFKDLTEKLANQLTELKPDLLDIQDLLAESRTLDSTDTDSLQAINDEMQKIVDKTEKSGIGTKDLESDQKDLLDKMNLENCFK